MHNNDTRVTLIYKGLGSFTFDIKKAVSLVELSEWRGTYQNRDFQVRLSLDPQNNKIVGEGKDENDVGLCLEINLNQYEQNNWSGYYETEDETIPFIFENLTIDHEQKTISASWTDEDSGHSYFI